MVKDPETRLSIILVTYNSAQTIEQCLNNLLSTLQPIDEIILVDNASKDATVELVSDFIDRTNGGPSIKLIRGRENKGFAGACNKGFHESKGEFVVFLNPDVFVTSGWVERFLAHFERNPHAGAVGPISNYAAGLQNYRQYFSIPEHQRISYSDIAASAAERFAGQAVRTKLIIGFCLMMPRKVFQAIGLFDETLFLGNDDVDISWRLQLYNYQMLVAVDSFVFHVGQVSFKSNPDRLKKYLSRQSTFAMAGKLLKYYGRDSVRSELEGLGFSIFPEWTLDIEATIVVYHGNADSDLKKCLDQILHGTQHNFHILVTYRSGLSISKSCIDLIEKENWRTVEVTSADFGTFFESLFNRLSESPVVFVDSRVRVTKGWLTLLLAALGDEEIIGVFPKVRTGPDIDKKAREASKTLGDLSKISSFDLRCFMLEKDNLMKLCSREDIQGLSFGAQEKVEFEDKKTHLLLVNDALVGWVPSGDLRKTATKNGI